MPQKIWPNRAATFRKRGKYKSKQGIGISQSAAENLAKSGCCLSDAWKIPIKTGHRDFTKCREKIWPNRAAAFRMRGKYQSKRGIGISQSAERKSGQIGLLPFGSVEKHQSKRGIGISQSAETKSGQIGLLPFGRVAGLVVTLIFA